MNSPGCLALLGPRSNSMGALEAQSGLIMVRMPRQIIHSSATIAHARASECRTYLKDRQHGALSIRTTQLSARVHS